MKTISAKQTDIERKWYLVDAQDQVLGRLASEVATILRGKHKPVFTPHVDCGDHVVIVNAAGIHMTGNKINAKTYHSHSDYPGGFKTYPAKRMMESRPDRIVRWAVEGMLPKTKLGKAMAKKLRVYSGSEHPHQAQKLAPLKFEQANKRG
ncbi:MAG TPA: 50S ribosomal protein L13 [Nitrospiria bacterium]|nr:50S ribosomal protein L13 [Nitrospiria bacterium]